MQAFGVQDLRILLQGYFGYNFPSRTNMFARIGSSTPWYEELHVESQHFMPPFRKARSPNSGLCALVCEIGRGYIVARKGIWSRIGH